MTATDGTRLSRKLRDAARRPIAAAVEAAAGRAAAAFDQAAPEIAAETGTAGGRAAVTLTGPGLFAREFGALDSAADPLVAPAIRRLKRRPA